jgi:hypothetical protein
MASIGRRDASFALGFSKTLHVANRSFSSYGAVRAMAADPIPGELFTTGIMIGR